MNSPVCDQYGHYKDYKTGKCKHCNTDMGNILMPSFDEVYNIARESGSEAAFNIEEGLAIWDLLMTLAPNATVVEIGVQFGRSTSIFAEVHKHFKDEGFTFTAIDNWSEDVSPEAKAHVLSQMKKYNWSFDLKNNGSLGAVTGWLLPIDLIHIDGDHTLAGVLTDCTNWLPLVKKGGFVCFDDYGHDSLPEVYQAVTKYMATNNDWRFINRYGKKLGVFQKI